MLVSNKLVSDELVIKGLIINKLVSNKLVSNIYTVLFTEASVAEKKHKSNLTNKIKWMNEK